MLRALIKAKSFLKAVPNVENFLVATVASAPPKAKLDPQQSENITHLNKEHGHTIETKANVQILFKPMRLQNDDCDHTGTGAL